MTQERLARVRGEEISYLTVLTTDGSMVAFKYDTGTYGWAERSSFVPIAEAEERVRAIRDRRERERTNERLRIKSHLTREIERAEAEAERYRSMLARYVDEED